MKVPQKAESFYILNSLLELIIKIRQFGICFPSKSGNFGFFFSWKILWTGWNHFSELKFGENSPVKETQEGPIRQPWSNLFTTPCFFGMNSFTKVLQSIESFFWPDWVKTRVFLQFYDMKFLEFFWVWKLAKFVFTWKQICPKFSQSFDHKNDKLCWTKITSQRYSLISIQEKILTISFIVFQKCTGK
jgi:hypothetical protein